MTIAAHAAALTFAHAAPHTVRDLEAQCELEAVLPHGAERADGLGLAHGFPAGGEEVDFAGMVHALGVLLPRRSEIIVVQGEVDDTGLGA